MLQQHGRIVEARTFADQAVARYLKSIPEGDIRIVELRALRDALDADGSTVPATLPAAAPSGR